MVVSYAKHLQKPKHFFRLLNKNLSLGAILRLMKEFIKYGFCFLMFLAYFAARSETGASVFFEPEAKRPEKIIAAKGKSIKVIDGDSIFIGKTEIRLEGIDAPEYFQECYDAENAPYPCGKLARRALEKMVSARLECRRITTDKYHRAVCICYDDGVNINRKMVEDGHAVAYKRYTHDFDEAEKSAQKLKKGIWQGRFMKPEFYRILKKQKKNHK